MTTTLQPAGHATVWATVTLPGRHAWPGAPSHRRYLSHEHRHLFHVSAEVHVEHSERDVEFHDLMHLIRTWWGTGTTRACGSDSCETLAAALCTYLAERGLNVARTTVSEDGEAGATWHPAPAPIRTLSEENA